MLSVPSFIYSPFLLNEEGMFHSYLPFETKGQT
nr:MAG TPA: hypothetical protein [Bacteriophage sp.]